LAEARLDQLEHAEIPNMEAPNPKKTNESGNSCNMLQLTVG